MCVLLIIPCLQCFATNVLKGLHQLLYGTGETGLCLSHHLGRRYFLRFFQPLRLPACIWKKSDGGGSGLCSITGQYSGKWLTKTIFDFRGVGFRDDNIEYGVLNLTILAPLYSFQCYSYLNTQYLRLANSP